MSSSSDWIQLKRQLEREFFAGGIAGSVGIFIGFPLDMVKVKLQVFPDQYKSAWQCLKQCVQEDGFTGLYKGCLPPILIQGLINSLMFVGESLATKVLEPNLKAGEIGSPVNTYLAGMAGGVLQCVALVPSEVIKCSMQTEVGGNATQSEFQRTASCVRNIYRSEGFFGLYRGWNATVLRETPSIGMYFFSYKYSKEALTNMQGLKEANDTAIMVAGGIAGAMSWSFVYPFDVIKTIIQSTPANSNGESLTIMNTARSLYRRHGYSIFFRGLGTTIVRAFPVNASTFFCYEKLKHLLHLEHLKEDQEFDGLYR